jgi:hypothetical protein
VRRIAVSRRRVREVQADRTGCAPSRRRMRAGCLRGEEGDPVAMAKAGVLLTPALGVDWGMKMSAVFRRRKKSGPD